MRTLKILCGISVILVTFHLGHGIHHFLTHDSPEGLHGPALWTAAAVATVVGILSLIGGVLLLKSQG